MADDVYARVGAMIRAKRVEIGMTQASLAGKTGLGRTSNTNIENGSQSILLHQLVELAQALHIDPREFLCDIDRTRIEASTTSASGRVAELMSRLDQPIQARRR